MADQGNVEKTDAEKDVGHQEVERNMSKNGDDPLMKLVQKDISLLSTVVCCTGFYRTLRNSN